MSTTIPVSPVSDTRQSTEPTSGHAAVSRSWLLIGAVLLVAHLPLLYRYFHTLWFAKEHYQFFPLALLAAAGFTWYRRRPEWPTVDATVSRCDLCRHPAARRGVAGAVAGWGRVGSCVLATWFLHRSRDRFTGGTLTTVALLVLLIVHPPQDKDLELRTNLQFLTAGVSSGLLNLAGYNHLPLGTVLEFPGKQFFVEEACSGIRSLLTLMFLSVLYGVLMRRGLLHTVFLAGSAILWSAFANMIRMLAITIGYASWGLALDSGWQHELLGFERADPGLAEAEFRGGSWLFPITGELHHIDIAGEMLDGPAPFLGVMSAAVQEDERMGLSLLALVTEKLSAVLPAREVRRQRSPGLLADHVDELSLHKIQEATRPQIGARPDHSHCRQLVLRLHV